MNLPGAKAAIKAFNEARNGDTVSEAEIVRRNQLCLGCPRRKKIKGAVSRASQFLGYLTNKHRVPDEIAKYRCDACGCALSLLIPSKTLHPDTPEQEALRPARCWVLTAEKQEAKRLEEESRKGSGRCSNC